MTDRVWFEGIEELYKVAETFERRTGQVGQQGSKVLRRTALAIEKTAKEIVRVDTGNLKNSITTDFEGDGRFGTMSSETGPEAEYGGYLEWGTSKQEPAPYMGPAMDKHVPSFIAALEQLADPFERPPE